MSINPVTIIALAGTVASIAQEIDRLVKDFDVTPAQLSAARARLEKAQGELAAHLAKVQKNLAAKRSELPPAAPD